MKLQANPDDIERYVSSGWWEENKGLSDFVEDNAKRNPNGVAYQNDEFAITWINYFQRSNELAQILSERLGQGERVLVWLPDNANVHIAYLACEIAGLIAVGVGWKAGLQELKYLSDKTTASILISNELNNYGTRDEISKHLNIESIGIENNLENQNVENRPPKDERGVSPSDLWFLNSTSGTTGLPKCVMQTQNRWFYFHKKAVEFGNLDSSDIWMSVVPAPFGFGLWTAHVTPTLLGIPCFLQERFDPKKAAEQIEKYSVTVLCAVSSQFVMILDASTNIDLSSLKVIFTGGEAISPSRARELEDKSGCRVLNFYGSNETGTLSGTKIFDPSDKRRSTAGKVIPEMQVRLYEPSSKERLPDVGKGQPACKGPALSLGYWMDDLANSELMTEDGWFLMGDLVEIEPEGWLRVTGRVSDFIIRGGKNISAVAVEREVELHPKVALVAVVPKPDERLGETAAAYVQLHKGEELDLEELKLFLGSNGVSIEWWPESLYVLENLPISSGGKVAKGELRQLMERKEINK